ncbi:Transcription initiation factor TFIID subunit 4 [Merluccius polli]|uniref:Transcription initiation factor TFIID subunit 4 n=1 Tax=Merluccius polli TaxID=89951 RepID=A0AA47MDY4_MERPO|nr:Transcription initiation factor TFIID subunit 4 [Merluccius polli]
MSSAHTSGGSASGGAAAAATGGPGSPQGLPGAATPPPHSVIQTRVTTSQAGGPVTTTATPVPVPARTPAMHTTPGPPAAAADVALNGTTNNNNNNAAAAGQPTSVRPPPVNNGQQQPAVVSLGAIRTEPPKPVAQHQGPSPAAGPRTVGPAPGPGRDAAADPPSCWPRGCRRPPHRDRLTESGQLLMIHQQALAQMQAQAAAAAAAPRPATPTATPPAQAPGLPMGSRHMAPGSMVRQGSPGVATSVPPTTALHRPPVLQSSGGSALPGIAPRTGPQTTGTTVTSGPISNETMENVKKCRNFLSTLIKLASTGKQSAETADNVKELVKQLLEGKLEAEDFTSKLYSELNSSPQPYLVPFLKKPPGSEAADPQCSGVRPAESHPPPACCLYPAARPNLSPLRPLWSWAAPAPRITTVVARPQIQPGISRPGPTNQMLLQAQPQAAVMRPQVTMATTPVVTPRNQTPGQIILGPQQLRQLNTGPPGRTAVLPVSKPVPPATLSPAQKNKLKEAVATFKDDDDINDVASMAGVNLTEENARILATNSELVGAVTRSCKDEAFLSTTMLQKRMVEIGKRFGVTELGIDVVTYVSHAHQQRLQKPSGKGFSRGANTRTLASRLVHN